MQVIDPFNSAFAVAKPLVMPVNSFAPSDVLNNVILIDPIEAYLKNVINSNILNENYQLINPQTAVNNLQCPLNRNMPVDQMYFVNQCQSDSVANNLNLAQEIVKNLKIEGLPNLPFLNGLPVAGITETVTVLNSPCK
ncbi:hypothetical protein HF086_014168 [Spodoptera exigua]|nr:hypothetical protein HF086_014168 [Spodoptera exigua]